MRHGRKVFGLLAVIAVPLGIWFWIEVFLLVFPIYPPITVRFWKTVEAGDIHPVGELYAAGNHHGFYRAPTTGDYFRVFPIDAETFVVLGDFIAKDDFRVYDRGKRLAGADGATFELLDRSQSYGKDARHVYYFFSLETEDKILAGADAATFKIYEYLLPEPGGGGRYCWIGVDKEHVYQGEYKLVMTPDEFFADWYQKQCPSEVVPRDLQY